ncbi:hypothetical protein PR048_026992 [Dryococelus australis]|uniref:Uncharacterized protein n=1 Tax=Dryococelus australis TaxID=614101 RepID=A0ABQ9GMW5_9NEOP|nr:hypothetical protein PR048_026992 [Dryococelus australis]
MYRYIFSCDEAKFAREGMSNTRDAHVKSEVDQHATLDTSIEHHFRANTWRRVVVETFAFQRYLTGNVYLQNECRIDWDMCHWNRGNVRTPNMDARHPIFYLYGVNVLRVWGRTKELV